MASENETLDPFSHVSDSNAFEFFETANPDSLLHGFHLPGSITKFMVLELLAAGLLVWGFVWVARRIATGQPPRGKLWNFLEFILLFIRDQIAKPAIGDHDYKRFLPYLWTLFLFIIVLNLFGMIPFLASATASLAVTAALALVSFCVIHYNGFKANHGFIGYMKTFIPHIDMNDPIMKVLGPPILVGMFFLEILGAFIRALVLAVRLFANMLAGHTVLVIILSFIKIAVLAGAGEFIVWGVTFSSVMLVVALSMLELFVACLQAFVFTFLTAIFIGLAMHPQH
ncbi:MAG: F0F1 ATP synthase subunit A [Planctomycetes bacterium]|nr:F0F1 ATP synthase subunit A [Planctomycetota bacterium]